MGAIQVGIAHSADLGATQLSSAAVGGYGLDPNLVTPQAPWPRTLDLTTLAVIDILADAILPGNSSEPEPSKIGISAFFDEWLSAPYQKQRDDRQLILGGLGQLDTECQSRYGCGVRGLSLSQVEALLAWLAADITSRPFFARFRYLVVGAYFTTDAGMELLGYRGNVPLDSFPPITSEARLVIQQELSRLGLPWPPAL
jgi:hypothetical protein